MSDETRRFPSGEPARLDEQAAPEAAPAGTPTTYLPPGNGAAPTAVTERPPQVRPPGYDAPPPARSFRASPGIVPIVLICLGLYFLFGAERGVSGGAIFGSAIPLALGLIFLYVYRQQGCNYGFLIPGAILTGLGSGLVLSQLVGGDSGGLIPLGLGLGFVALWVVHRDQWWWLIPGSIISLAGLSALWDDGWRYEGRGYVPIFLIVLGAFFLMRRKAIRR